MMMKKKTFVLLLVLSTAGIASAITNNCISGGTNDWNTAANWSLGYVPYNGTLDAAGYADPLNEEAKITCAAGAGPVIETFDIVSAYRVFVAATGNGEFTIDGGTLKTNGYMTSAYLAGYNAVVNMISGSVQLGFTGGTNGHFYLGRYGTTTLNMSGGTFDIQNDLNMGQYAGSTGIVNLSGGTLIASTLKHTGTASMTISGLGKLILRGDDTAVVETWIASGWLNDGLDVFYDYNVTTPGATTVYVPEPATLCLLGFGALSLLRRK